MGVRFVGLEGDWHLQGWFSGAGAGWCYRFAVYAVAQQPTECFARAFPFFCTSNGWLNP